MRYLKATNTAAFTNDLATTTHNEAVEGVDEFTSFASGSMSSAKADITVGRFDVVPLLTNMEYYFWFGAHDEDG